MKNDNYEHIQYQIEIKTPTIILPFDNNDDKYNQCWVF